jgi:hypothetical protein
VTLALALAACASADNGGSSATKPAKEIASGGATLHGGGLRMDVQVGHAQPKKPTKNAAVKMSPQGAVTP